jgi:hypothetical protein
MPLVHRVLIMSAMKHGIEDKPLAVVPVIRVISFALLLTMILPPLIFVVFAASSMAIGLLVCALMWSFAWLVGVDKALIMKKSDAYHGVIVLIACVLLTLHVTVINLLIGGVDFSRFASSCSLLLLLYFGANLAARKLGRVPDAKLVKAANFSFMFLTSLAIAAIAGLPAVGSQSSGKAVVVFSEPSHYALAYLPVLLFRISVVKQRTQVLLLGIAFFLAVALQSLTMVVGILIVATLLLRRFQLALVGVVIFVAALTLTLDLDYYTSRLDFSSESTNLSALVFLQGWQRAILNFKETYGIGVGFQQFGLVGSFGEIAENIANILGDYSNLRDGGSTATKLIAEFGVVGVAILFVFMKVAIQGAIFIREAQLQSPIYRDQRRLFFYSFIFTYTMELFIRGVGYFSPGGFLAVVALISLSNRTSVSLTSTSDCQC